MAKRKFRRRKKTALDYIALPRLPEIDLDPDTKKGIFVVFLMALGAISLLGLFDLAGVLGGHIKEWLVLAFGWGKWVFPVMLLLWGYFLHDEERDFRGVNYIGMLLFLLSFQALLLLFVEFDQWEVALKTGSGGGYVGWLLANSFIKLMGFWASLIVLFCLIIISVLLTFNTTLIALFGKESFFAKALYPLNFVIAKIFRLDKGEKGDDEDDNEEDEEDEEDEDEENEDDEDDDEEDEEDEEDEDEENEDDEDDDEEDEEDEEKEKIEEPKFTTSEIKNIEEENKVWWEPTNINIQLPLSLLDSTRGKPTSGDIKDNQEVMQRTLKNFGIPVEMGSVSVGPTVTQYTFKPAEGIKLSKITTLSNDLALALAAHPIRIEAPIPGKRLVGVEVPNQIKATVSLREILSSKIYKKRKNNLMMALGKDVAGNAWLDDITKMPHLLVAGATNSGKSVCLNSIIVSLMYQNNPDDLRFILVDPKRVELTMYDRIPYLLCPVITDIAKTVNALKWCLNEMDRRFDILQKCGKKDIRSYNEEAKIKMPYIVFIIDELADLMVAAAKDIEAGVIRLAQMARAVGIHLVLATQRPSVDVITGLIKANMPARIAFSVASGTDSRTIIDTLGAEKLLGRGDMLFMNAEMSKPIRLQGAFLGENEIKKIVRYVVSKGGKPTYIENITDRQKVNGIGGFGLNGNDDVGDELLEEAKELIVNQGKASASLLQRRLSVGYARAARLLDILEQAGIVGPSNGSKPREILISKEQYEANLNQGVSGVSLHNRDEAKAPDEYLNSLGEEPEDPPAFLSDEESDNDEDDDEEESDDEEKNDEDEEEDEDLDNDEEKDENEDDEDEEGDEDEEDENEENEDDDSNSDTDEEEDDDDGKYFSR